MADKGPEVKSCKVGATRKASNCSELNFHSSLANLILSYFPVFICRDNGADSHRTADVVGTASG